MSFLPGDNAIFGEDDIYYDEGEKRYEDIDEESSEESEELPEVRK